MGMEYTVDHIDPIAKKVEDIYKFMQGTTGPSLCDFRYYTYLRYSQFNSIAEEKCFPCLKKRLISFHM